MSELRALVVDWGGVLTGDVHSAVQRWADAEAIDQEAYAAAMRDWFGEQVGLEARVNPIHALERGEMTLPDFEVRLAAELDRRTGRAHDPSGLLNRMIAGLGHAEDMAALVRRAHDAGLRTALLSNSWGNEYPRDGWDDMFDVVVISGEVGMRKPEPRIFEHTTELLGVEPGECVFVDDIEANIAAAVALGWVGVLHTGYETTRLELEALFDVPLS